MPAPKRLTAALLLLAGAALLLVPGASPPSVTWDDLVAPLGAGRPVTHGYVLSPPRRGSGHDVVYTARRDPGTAGPLGLVQVHIFDRGPWPTAAHTRSFTVVWEDPPAGSMTAASLDDRQAVRDALAEAISRNDTSFASVDSVPLANERDPPAISRILERLVGMRGRVVGIALALAIVLIASMPRGAIAAGALLFALGLVVRAPSLGVPFVHDQDVQRLFTGSLPLSEIATGAGLRDRHPPLYFFILHFVEQFGQSEAIGRVPAVLAGALIAPTILLATAIMRGRVSLTAALAALAIAISPELIAASREVSEIPLFALIVIGAAAALVAAVQDSRPARLAMLALMHALALLTYYLAPFIIAANAAVLAWRRPDPRVVRAFSVGVVVGVPALVLGGLTLFRDWGARDVARAFPTLAWGQHSPAQMAMEMARIAVEALGLPLLLLILAAVIVGTVRRDLAVITPAVGAAATFAGIALLSPIARVQAYYVTTVLPLLVLALAATPEPRRRAYRTAWLAALVLAIALFTVPLLAGARTLYMPAADAFMPSFAAAIAERPEATVVTVAHYDKTLLAYYLVPADDRPVGWDTLEAKLPKPIEPLVLVHAFDADSEQLAARRLDEILAAGPALVLERDALLLPSIVERLSACDAVLQAPTARLLRCGPSEPPMNTDEHR